MNIPTSQQKSRHRIAEAIYKNGAPMPFDEVRKIIIDGMSNAGNALNAINGMLKARQLFQDGELLRLHADVESWIADCIEHRQYRAPVKRDVVPPRVVNVMSGELNAKRMYASVTDRLSRELHVKHGLSSPVEFAVEGEL